MEKDGYYNKIQARNPLGNWPYDESRDATFPKFTSGPLLGAGYPYCKNWWSDAGIGLKERVVKAVRPDFWAALKIMIFRYAEAEQDTIRQLVSPAHLIKTNEIDSIFSNTADNSRSSGFADGAKNAIAAAGAVANGMSFFSSMSALRTALPMLQSSLIMGIIISLPLIIVLSTYNLKVVMMASFGLFTLHMLTFWWELARWLESSLIKALYGESNPLLFATPTETLGVVVLNLVAAGMFIILPGLFFVSISWAGYALGRGMDGILGGGTKDASAAGAAGGKMAANAGASIAKAVVTRGAGKGK